MSLPTSALQLTSRPGNYKVQVKTDGTAVLVPGNAGSSAITVLTPTLGVAETNTTGATVFISGWLITTTGGAVGNLSCVVGSPTPTETVYANEATATVTGAAAGFGFPVPAGYQWWITATGADTAFGNCVQTVIG